MTTGPLRLMLVDEDPVFRLGLRIWLERSGGCEVVAEAGQVADALAILASRVAPAPPPSAPPEPDWAPAPAPAWAEDWASEGTQDRDSREGARPDLDLVILDLGLGVGRPDQLPGLSLCADIKARYPALPVLVLSAQVEPVLEAAARQMGADGFGARGMAVEDLGQLVNQLARPGCQRPPFPSTGPNPIRPTPSARGQRPPTVGLRSPARPPWPGALAALRTGMRRSAVQQIEAVMAQIEAEQRRGRGSLLEEAVLAGRYRELLAARWLVRRLLATPTLDDPRPSAEASPTANRDLEADGLPWSTAASAPAMPRSPRLRTGLPAADALAVTASPGRLAPDLALPSDLATLVFERVFRQLQGLLDNTSDIPLETDILRDDKKRELLYLVLRKFEDALDQLRQAGVPPGQLAENSPLVLRDLWEAALGDFFGRYYTLQTDTLEQPVVPTLLTEAPVVQAAILDRIPLVPMLLGHLLFNEALVVDGGVYQAATPEALARSQELLENLLIQVANGVVQPVLNHFADVESIKKHLYHRRLMTSRDIERFRNDLSWRYRWDGLVNEPQAIFESRYRLFGFTERGIQNRTIYSPRREELDRLSGLQRAVTLAVEARDAVAPRFRSAVALVGSGLVYVLTDVIGRGIGLIGRGILRGVGNAWRDPREGRGSPSRNDSNRQDGNMRG